MLSCNDSELLNVIRETENDDLTGVMQRLVCTYVEEVTPLAVSMTTHLADTFAKVLETDADGSEEKAITALGILNTMETILNVMEEQRDVRAPHKPLHSLAAGWASFLV